MSHIVIRVFEVIIVAFIVSGVGTTIYNIVTFRERSDRIFRRGRIGRIT
jgi:hypothetical protein